MTNLVETFIEDVRMAEQLSGSNRPLAIRQKITEYEDIIVRNGAGCEPARPSLSSRPEEKSGQYLAKQKTERFRR
jgi:hypothetical protein